MGALAELGALLSDTLADWPGAGAGDLRFWEARAAWLLLLTLVAVAITMLLVRSTVWRRPARARVVLPALLAGTERSWLSAVRHLPVVLVVAGLPWLALAVADPYTSLRQEEVTFPGRRIGLMIDASSSMVRQFSAPTLNLTGPGSQASFFTTVGAAYRFVELRRESEYRDLMALIEFGNEAYVVTPFTTDYDNILLSLTLIGDFGEFVRFPDQGTVLTSAVEQGIRLFDAFDFLDATGNLLVLFSDGEDSGVLQGDTTVLDVVAAAEAAEVPIYFVRTRYQREFGGLISDERWRDAVERTGGRFYAASDEEALLAAISDIDRASVGEIEVNQYVTQRPAFGPYAAATAGLWSLAALLALVVPQFRRFP
jgi:Ca-activated chloride channel family protein